MRKLCSEGGRLHSSRKAVIDAVKGSEYLTLVKPRGSMYAFIGVQAQHFPGFDDELFAMELLEEKHVLVAPGSSFNTDDRHHFRITILPDEEVLTEVFVRINEVLEHMANRPPKLETA